MLTYLFAALAAIANAVSSVLQRKADRDQPSGDNLSLRLIADVFRRPAFLGGILSVTIGFLLQAAALGNGALAVVEPVLIFELPATLLLAAFVLHRHPRPREWWSAAAMTGGLVGLLIFLAPSQTPDHDVPPLTWAIGLAVTIAAIVVLVVLARRGGSGRRSALLGVATGTTFGLTAALIKAVTVAFAAGGIGGVFLTWQTYGMIVAGCAGLFLLQSALNAGPLVAAQPGFTGADPVVAILWGVLVFGETVRGGVWVAPELVSAAVIALGVWGLSGSAADDA